METNPYRWYHTSGIIPRPSILQQHFQKNLDDFMTYDNSMAYMPPTSPILLVIFNQENSKNIKVTPSEKKTTAFFLSYKKN